MINPKGVKPIMLVNSDKLCIIITQVNDLATLKLTAYILSLYYKHSFVPS